MKKDNESERFTNNKQPSNMGIVSNEEMRAQLDEKERLATMYYDQLLRLKAEFENYRKRVEREKENHRIWGKEEILLKQISLYDIIGQALESVRTTKNTESIIVGLEMIYKEFEKMLIGEGINTIDATDVFDPHLHEAVETVEDESKVDGTIVSVFQKGYIMNDRVIRPAKVKIVKNKIVDSK